MHEEVDFIKIDIRLTLIGILIVISTMVAATQFAITDLRYEYQIIIPTIQDHGLKFFGSDNSTDGIRLLRSDESRNEGSLKIVLGNVSKNSSYTYTAAFGIVNEENYSISITHIEVLSESNSNINIWLHGNRLEDASNSTNDPTSVLMFSNGNLINCEDTIAWKLAGGDNNGETICNNTQNREKYTNTTSLDEIANVRYSLNNSMATSGVSDYVWVQVQADIPYSENGETIKTGNIVINYQTD